MQNKDAHRFNLGMNKDDHPTELQPGEYTDALNMRVASSTDQQGVGIFESLQGEIELLINVSSEYYGGAIGGKFIYEGYEEVTIGSQVWMKKNWHGNYPGSKVYDDDETNRDVYGGLYTWDMTQAVDFCPAGWRVPTEADIDELLAYLGGAMIAGGKLKEYNTPHWNAPNVGASDEYGFTALPGGKFSTIFDLLGNLGMYWISAEGVDTEILLTTTINGIFNFTLKGTDDVMIDWGDGSSPQLFTLTGTAQMISHYYPAEGVVKIVNATAVTLLMAANEDVTNAVIPATCTAIEEIYLNNNHLTSFTAHPEWVNLKTLSLNNNNLNSFTTHPEWVNLSHLWLTNNNLNTIVLYEWNFSSLTEACSLYLDYNDFATITIPATWRTDQGIFSIRYNDLVAINLTNLYHFGTINIEHNNIVNVTNPVGDVYWTYFYGNNNAIATFNLSPANLPNLRHLILNDNVIDTFTLNNTATNIWTINLEDNLIVSFTAQAEWGELQPGHRRFQLTNNNLDASSVEAILMLFDAIVGASEWTDGDYLNIAGGTSSAPVGDGLLAKAALIAQAATIITNMAEIASIIGLFDYLWIGQVVGDYLISETDGRRITIIGKDFAGIYIPDSSVATFQLAADPDFILDDAPDHFWFDAGGNQNIITLADLIGADYTRTFIKYANFSPYNVYAIGLLNSGVVLTPAQIDELHEYFWLWLFWSGVLNDYGFLKDNRLLP